MFPAAMRVLQIKDLKDLSVLLVRRCYRHAGPKGPEEMFLTGVLAGETRSPARVAGEGPRATVVKAASIHRRARACPSPCLDRNGKWRWPMDDFRVDRTLAGDRPPRYGCEAALRSSLCRAGSPDPASSGSGDPELRSLGHAGARGGQAPARRFARPSPFHRRAVGKPVPRRANRLKQDLHGHACQDDQVFLIVLLYTIYHDYRC